MSAQPTGGHLAGTTAPKRGPGGMYVHESGTPGSPAIVFIHGLGQSGREWRQHMAELAGFHCLAPDLPGFGRSSHLPLPSNERIADLLAELIRTRVPAGRAHVVGISWGAVLTQVLVQRHPDRVDRAVADGLPVVWPRWARPLMLWLVTLVAPFLHTRPVLALYRDIVDAADLRVASRLAFWRVWAVGLPNLTPATGALCPTLLVAGEKEGLDRPGLAALAQLMPHAEAWFAPGLGHCWQRKAPDLHRRMVEAWLAGRELPAELRPEPPPSPAAVERLRRVSSQDSTGVTRRRRRATDGAADHVASPSGGPAPDPGGPAPKSRRYAMRRILVVGVAAAFVAGAAALVPRSQGTTLKEWRRRLVWSWAAVPSGPLGWVSSRVMPYGHGPIYRLMDESLDLRPDDDLLEVACGSGYFLERYASHVRHVAGLDLSGIQVDLARKRLAGRIAAGTAEIVQGDAGSLPWADGRFSAVVCNSIDAFPDPARALAEMQRVLCPGGRAAILLGARVAEGTVSHLDPTWGWVWTEPDARRLVEEAGLEVGSISYGWILGGGDLRMVWGVKPPLCDAGRHKEARPALVGMST